MRGWSWIRAAVFLSAILAGGLGFAQEAAPRTGVYTVSERLDLDMVKRHDNFGYSDEEIRKYFDFPQVYEFDATGLAAERVKSPPAPGVHPRVFFDGQDLPALRKKLGESKPGKLQMDAIRATLTKDLTGEKARFASLYDAAVRGEGSPEMLDVQVSCAIIYEAFRCLIDGDDAGGKKAAAALVTLAKLDDAELDKAFAMEDAKPHTPGATPGSGVAIRPPLHDYQETKGLTQHGLLGLGYDFAYGWMDEAQRDVVRTVIAKASSNMTLLCAEGLPAFPANVSNWIPMHMRLILLLCAIEGEKGYDAGSYKRCLEGYKRHLNVACFPAGDMYESMGKGFLCAEDLRAGGQARAEPAGAEAGAGAVWELLPARHGPVGRALHVLRLARRARKHDTDLRCGGDEARVSEGSADRFCLPQHGR